MDRTKTKIHLLTLPTKIFNLPKLGILLNDLIQYNITSNTL